jgi:hypothetical protein
MAEQFHHDIRELQVEVFGDDERQEPGLKRRQTATDKEIHGSKGELGIKNRVDILWRIHVWLLCTLSGGAGVIATLIIQRLAKTF